MFVAIDDFSHELYVVIFSDRIAISAAKLLLRDMVDCCPYTIECVYSDNGAEYKGSVNHSFGIVCHAKPCCVNNAAISNI
ncbi:hypothetical protein H3L92_04190 [Neisseria dentiae]|nr:hypothetical protein H3L92_04190 [Neisseria dentiae]